MIRRIRHNGRGAHLPSPHGGRESSPYLGTKAVVPLYFDIDGNGRILSSSIKRRSGISVLDAAVASMLRSMRSLPKPPNGKRCQFTINLRVGEE